MAAKENPSSSTAPAADAPEPQKAAEDTPKTNSKPAKPNLRQIYALPAPIRTFPLPAFNPSNPLSLLQLAYTWAKQLISAAREPSVIHEGVWLPELGAVVIRDPASIRALWQQGFYGKGHLSRSEPNWFKAEQVRLGMLEDHVSEVYTAKRREERRTMKWERARAELEAIRQTRLEEAQRQEEAQRAEEEARVDAVVTAVEIGEKTFTKPEPAPPVGPLELLVLPNSASDLERWSDDIVVAEDIGLNGTTKAASVAPVGPLELLSLPNSVSDLEQQCCAKAAPVADSKEHMPNGEQTPSVQQDVQLSESPHHTQEAPLPNGTTPQELETAPPKTPMKRRKSVRFSPKVHSTTVDLSTPPSPDVSALNGKPANGRAEDVAPLETTKDSAARHAKPAEPAGPTILIDKEHLQLTREEAFFLSFALGTLTVQTQSKEPIPTRALLELFRSYSYNPPAQAPLSPDDPFLVHYVTYHHFRSLGFAPRPGIKFAVDWLLYLRGPVFDHAEYGVVVAPSYSHPHWKEAGKTAREMPWSWFHGTSRTLSHAVKTIAVAYVEVPPPDMFEEALEKGVVDVLSLYSVKEVIVKRWSPNRNRKS